MKLNSPLVSICIPVYNGEMFVAKSIRSALDQDYQNVEVLVQDNASTDGTWRILEEEEKVDSRVSIQRNAHNQGMVGNWNTVLSRAVGDYVMLLSADDMIHETFVSRCLEVFQNTNTDAVTANHFILANSTSRMRKMKLREGKYTLFISKVLLFNPFSINFTLFRRQTFVCLGDGRIFHTNYHTCDYDLWIRTALSGLSVYYLNAPLGTYRRHSSNLSGDFKRMYRQTVLTLLRHDIDLRKFCAGAYRFTLIRFMIRLIIKGLLAKRFDTRLFRILGGELLQSWK